MPRTTPSRFYFRIEMPAIVSKGKYEKLDRGSCSLIYAELGHFDVVALKRTYND